MQITDANKTRFYVISTTPQPGTHTHAVLVAICLANKIDDIIVELHNDGLDLVAIHDRPEGNLLGSCHYILEVENQNGIAENRLEKIEGIPEIRCLGCFEAVEKQD